MSDPLAPFTDIRTPEDARRYIDSLLSQSGRDLPSVARWRRASKVTLVVLLGFSVLQFYFMNVFIEILSMSSVTVFVPLVKGGSG
jgi:hypothetical protein